MKNFKSITSKLIMLLAISYLVSCGESEEPNIIPSISITSDDFNADLNSSKKVGESVSFVVNIAAPNVVDSIIVKSFIELEEDITIYEKAIGGDNLLEFTTPNIIFNLEERHTNKSLKIVITVTDNRQNRVTETLYIGSVGKYSIGVLILNEGNFGTANSSVSYFDNVSATVTNNIYNDKTGKILGDVAQSLFVLDDNAYIIVNNSNTVEVVNSHTFGYNYTIDAALPRYFTFSAPLAKGYLSEWVAFGSNGRVSVINLENGNVETSIEVGSGAENLIEVNGKLYVSNNFQSDISVIDLSSNSVTATIDVTKAPGQYSLDANGDLWVICGGGLDENWAPLNNGAFYKINTADNTITTTIELGVNVPTKTAMNASKDIIYYYKGNEVFALDINDTAKPSSAFITEAAAVSFYGIGVNPSTGNIYVGDSKGFQANGVVYRYNAEGTAIDNFTVGIGPNGFIFR